ncbi:ATP-dependent protease subunit HslV [Spirochaetota bacterium]|nr:ATP-dependent protease subunit HslV [Spirochaetota bacterium]
MKIDYQDSALFKSTTIIAVKKKRELALAGDGQVTLGTQIMKNKATKIRRLYKNSILSGFAGAAADALTIYERMEKKLEEYEGDLLRASVELTKEWRSDKYLRKLEAMLLLGNKDYLLILSGTGEVIECDSGVAAIGSGGGFAKSAALALVSHSSLSAEKTAKTALTIAAEICIYTNSHISCETLKY